MVLNLKRIWTIFFYSFLVKLRHLNEKFISSDKSSIESLYELAYNINRNRGGINERF